MRVDKVIIRSALSTLGAIVALFAVMLLALCFIFPATMMRLTYDLGMDGASIRSAKRAYDYTGEVYYIAFATETAIGAELLESVETCGESLIIDDEFASYCEKRNEETETTVGYEQYIYAQICVAKYLQGEKAESVERAFALVGNAFPENNAITAVLLTALSREDTQTANAVLEKMNEMNTDAFSLAEKEHYTAMRGLLQNG